MRAAHVAAVLAVSAAVLAGAPAGASASVLVPQATIYGSVRDAQTLAKVPCIKVQAFMVNYDGTFTPSTVAYSDANGDYSLTVVPGPMSYRVVFTDLIPNPYQVFGDYVHVGRGFIEAGSNVTLNYDGDSVLVPAFMPRSSLVQVNVKRAGQWATPLSGMFVRIASVTDVALRGYTTDSSGSVLRGGIPYGQYVAMISDPAGKFATTTMPGPDSAHALDQNDEWIADASLPLLNAAANVVVSKPSCGSTVKHGVALPVSGTLSRRITSPKTMRLDAYQWSSGAKAWVLNTSSTLKVSNYQWKSKYAGSITLPWAGSWRLVAVFGGNTKLAQSGSTYKSVKVS